MAPVPPPPPALADTVRHGRWAEVRTLVAAVPRPLAPSVALVAARAARLEGDAQTALTLLRTAIPGSGELAAALRLEAGETLLALGRDPWQMVSRLLERSAPAAQREAASDLLSRAFEVLPIPALRAYQTRQLAPALRRQLAATLAVRTADQAAATRVLRERRIGAPALTVALWASRQKATTPQLGVLAGEALLAGGMWREADALLATVPSFTDPSRATNLAFLRGRAAYRLGRFHEAAAHFDTALARAPDGAARFPAAVQRARVAEILGEWQAAAGHWEIARLAAPSQPEGWDGRARLLVALGRTDDALAVLRAAPVSVFRVVAPRTVAALLARGEIAAARSLLRRLPQRDGIVRFLAVAAALAAGDREATEAKATELLASPAAGAWRDLVFDVLREPQAAAPDAATPTRDGAALARIAVHAGRGAARRALEAALLLDPAWAPLLTGASPEPVNWTGPAADLVSAGLDEVAATLYPHRFPAASPADLAWSARALAEWGNGAAALLHGERLWAAVGPVPAELLPFSLLPHILPSPLVADITAAAGREGVDAAWLTAIVRRESRFARAARSPAGAIGVAQIVPETARRLGADPAELWAGDRAVGLAAREVARLSREMAGRLPLVAAAYNAGDAVVETWIEILHEPTDALFTAAVPYRETAAYVLAVREGVALARHLSSGGDTASSAGAPPPKAPQK